MIDLRDLFTHMLKMDASDLHLVVGAPPQVRVRGELESVPGSAPLQPEETRELVFGILTNEQRQKLEVQWEIDFSYAVPGLARWRVNAFFQRGAIGAAFRVIPEKIKPLNELGVPDSLFELCELPRGLVLVTGPTGSGKSTTLASMIDVINEQRQEHILTVEDPIEFIHKHKNCVVNQREVGADTDGFSRALKSALRQDPDVILVGEMRDLETIQTALTAAETGHLVFGTLHTNGAAKTVDRIIDVFPPHQQAQIRVQLASSLQGVVTQTLIPTLDGQRRVVACEVMIPNPAIRNLIREGKVFQIPSVMQTSQEAGMQTLDAALATLVRSNQIDRKEALKRSHEPHEFERLLAGGSGAPAPGKHAYTPPQRLRLLRVLDGPVIDNDGDGPVPVPQQAPVPGSLPSPAAAGMGGAPQGGPGMGQAPSPAHQHLAQPGPIGAPAGMPQPGQMQGGMPGMPAAGMPQQFGAPGGMGMPQPGAMGGMPGGMPAPPPQQQQQQQQHGAPMQGMPSGMPAGMMPPGMAPPPGMHPGALQPGQPGQPGPHGQQRPQAPGMPGMPGMPGSEVA